MEQMSQEFLRTMQKAASKGPSLEKVKSTVTPHGSLIGCAYYASSSGMQINSNTLLRISLSLADGVQQIICTKKEAFQQTTTTVYRPKRDILAEIRKLVERENLAAWSALEFHDPFPCKDYSSSSSISLYFDDNSVGGQFNVCVSINVSAACQHGGGDIIRIYRDLLENEIQDAEVISVDQGEPMLGTLNGFCMMGMIPKKPIAKTIPSAGQIQQPDSAWNCKVCGSNGNTGKYCPECGAKWEPAALKSDNEWKCRQCGYDANTGNFCSECGYKRTFADEV